MPQPSSSPTEWYSEIRVLGSPAVIPGAPQCAIELRDTERVRWGEVGRGLFGIVSIWHFTINTNFKKLVVESCQAWMALLLDTELEIHSTHMGRAMASTQFTQIYMVLILEHNLWLPASIKLSDPSYIHWFISFMYFATESHSSQNHNLYASKYTFSACWNCHLGANPLN